MSHENEYQRRIEIDGYQWTDNCIQICVQCIRNESRSRRRTALSLSLSHSHSLAFGARSPRNKSISNMTIIYTLKTLVNKQQKLNLISRMWFQLMRLVMVLFNAHFFSLALVSFLSFCLVSTIRFVFCRLIIRRGLYGEWTSKWQPQHKRINSHEQYAFQVCFDWMARELPIFLFLCVCVDPFHSSNQSIQPRVCVHSVQHYSRRKASRWHGKKSIFSFGVKRDGKKSLPENTIV